MPDSATRNTPLPPSVEKAYHTKCKELKQRLIEIEEANDGARQRKQRIDRAILKMRLERAILLERLQKVQLKGAGVDVADSERSNSPPPAEHRDRLPRPRRVNSPIPESPVPTPYRMRASSPGLGVPGLEFAQHPPPALAGRPPLQPIPTLLRHPSGLEMPHAAIVYPGPPPPGAIPIGPPPPGAIPIGPPIPFPFPTPYTGPPIDRRAPSEIPPSEALPLINTLPNGTNVVIIDGQPKQPPWTIRDVEPRHHLRAKFEQLPYPVQMEHVVTGGYTPYDVHGNPVVLHQANVPTGTDEQTPRIKHVFKDDPNWANPVHENVRQDDPWKRRDDAAAADRERARRDARRERDAALLASVRPDHPLARRASGNGSGRKRSRNGSSSRHPSGTGNDGAADEHVRHRERGDGHREREREHGHREGSRRSHSMRGSGAGNGNGNGTQNGTGNGDGNSDGNGDADAARRGSGDASGSGPPSAGKGAGGGSGGASGSAGGGGFTAVNR